MIHDENVSGIGLNAQVYKYGFECNACIHIFYCVLLYYYHYYVYSYVLYMYCVCVIVDDRCSLHYFMVKVVIILNRKLSFSNVTTSNTVKLL